MNSSNLRSFFYGTLLGDSYIHNGTFYCKQISKDLIYFKAKIIDKYLPDAKVTITEHDSYTDKNGVTHQKFWTLSVSKSEYIKKLEKLFYPNGVKVCPKNVINKLDNLGLAMWYADDGSTVLVQYNPTTKGAKSRRVQICTDSFSKEEHDNIILPELKQLGFEPTYVVRDGHYRVTLKNLKMIQKFFCDLGEYFYYFPSLLYKLDLGYRTSSLLNRTYVIEEYNSFYSKISAHPSFYDRMKRKEDIVQTTTLNSGLGN